MSDTSLAPLSGRTHRKPWFILAAALSAAVGPAATVPVSAQQSLVGSAALRELGYYTYWSVQLDLDRGGQVTAGYLTDDTLYCVTDKGDIHAIHAGVGLERWSRHLAESVYTVYAPTHFDFDGSRLGIYTTSTRIAVLDRYSGETVTDMPIARGMAGPASAVDDLIFFGSNDGHAYAMVWNDRRTASAVMRWRVLADGPVTGPVAVVHDGKDLVFASQAGSVFSCTANEKILNWVFQTSGPIFGDIAVDELATYVAGTDRSLYRVDTGTGAQVWRLRFPDPLDTGPVFLDGTVYQYCPRLGIAAVDARSGEMRWNDAAARQVITAGAEDVFLLGGDDRLLRVNLKTGEPIASIRLSGRTLGIVNPVDDAIYLTNAYGFVVCARPLETPHLTPRLVAEAKSGLRSGPRGRVEPVVAEKPAAVESPVVKGDPLRSTSDVKPLAAKRDGDE